MGIAIREFPTNEGPADYALFVNRTAVGVIEAKPEGTTLNGVSEQTEKYIRKFVADIPHVQLPLPFAYESTGIETKFRDLRDPTPGCVRFLCKWHFHQFSLSKPFFLQTGLKNDSFDLHLKPLIKPKSVTEKN